MIYIIYIFSIVLAYLFGSVPSSVWVGKLFYGVDVREHGSKNAGATNTFRVLGKKAGIPVLVFDILKGWLAVKITYYATLNAGTTHSEYVNLKLVLGIAAVLGHIYPIYVGFRGGKGVATLMGVVLALHWPASLVSLGVFIVIFSLFNYVSLASMTGAIAFPVGYFLTTYYVTGDRLVPSMVIFSICAAILVLMTHQKNIERLLAGTESKIRLRKKKETQEAEFEIENDEFSEETSEDRNNLQNLNINGSV